MASRFEGSEGWEGIKDSLYPSGDLTARLFAKPSAEAGTPEPCPVLLDRDGALGIGTFTCAFADVCTAKVTTKLVEGLPIRLTSSSREGGKCVLDDRLTKARKLNDLLFGHEDYKFKSIEDPKYNSISRKGEDPNKYRLIDYTHINEQIIPKPTRKPGKYDQDF